jgi:membrane protein implicated in regulation of membrane protease activity
MAFENVEQWLKGSIGGIILLGAVGSLLAVVVGWILSALAKRVLPAPYRAYRKQSVKQAYFMGFAHARIHHDETGQLMLALLIFRLARFITAITTFIFAAILASNILIFQAKILLTAGVFTSVVLAFLGLYWAYFEFEWIYRTYLWLWKTSVEAAKESYRKRQLTKEEDGGQKAEVHKDSS